MLLHWRVYLTGKFSGFNFTMFNIDKLSDFTTADLLRVEYNYICHNMLSYDIYLLNITGLNKS